jgi:hypothetical protein
MFGIRINNEYLDLPDNFKLRLRLENTLFHTEYKNAAYSFPATVPDTDTNRRLLLYASDVQVKSTAANGMACVLVCGTLEWNCLLWVDRSVYSKEMQITLKAVANTTGKKLLTDLEYGGVRNGPGDNNPLPENIEVTNGYTRSKDRDYYWGMYYNDFHFQGVINDIDSTGTLDVVSTALGIAATGLYTPMPYLNYVLRIIAEDMGVPTGGNWWKDDELDSLVIFNNRTLETYFISPPTIPSGWFWDDLNLKYHLPPVPIDTFINSLKNMFCLMVETYNGSLTLSSYRQILSDFVINDWTTSSRRVYERSRIPMDGYDIHSTYDEADVAYETYVKNLKELQYLGEFATAPVVGIVKGDWYYDTVYKSYYLYDGAAWQFYSFAAEGIKTGAGELVYETPMCAPIFLNYTAFPLGERIPWVDMASEGRFSGFFEDEFVDFGPRLVFARGWYDTQLHDPAGVLIEIPVISGEAVDFNGNVWGEYCLRYKDDEGLYNVWWKDFLSMATENDVNIFDLEMDDSRLAKWTFGEYLGIGGEVFYPKTLDVELSRKGVEKARVETLRWNG